MSYINIYMPKKSKKKSPKVGRVVIKKKPQTRKKIVEDIYEQYLNYYYDSGYKGKDLNTSSRGYNWGLGEQKPIIPY